MNSIIVSFDGQAGVWIARGLVDGQPVAVISKTMRRAMTMLRVLQETAVADTALQHWEAKDRHH